MLSGRRVLVTGGGSGIGKAICQTFSKEGAQVIVHDMNIPLGKELAGAIGGKFVHANFSNPQEVRLLAKESGKVDILVNNAGFQHVAPVHDFPEETFRNMLQVLLTAPFQLTKEFLPHMQDQRWGRIINIASIHAVVASPFKSAYISAKHGLLGFTKAVAVENGTRGITSNAICPAYVRTPLMEKQIQAQAEKNHMAPEDVVSKIMLEPAAIKRLIEPEEVADLALFLASDRGAAITGSTQMIDLGWTAR
eukprot:GILJ01004828.1.p1 GENE.GILJ01004828.1~~GILJ01004828.1.p1  ORF type:complete len:250 (-),score=36.91 GILJ01004828.1:259-1008(-)